MKSLKQDVVLRHVSNRRNDLSNELKRLESDFVIFKFIDAIIGFDDSSDEIHERCILDVMDRVHISERGHPMSCCLLTGSDLELFPNGMN